MNVSINERGSLMIQPTSGIEAYALKKWREESGLTGDVSENINIGSGVVPKKDGMSAEINENGSLLVVVSTPLESYALSRWNDENETTPENMAVSWYYKG